MARARKTISPDPYQKELLRVLPPEQSRPGILPEFLAPTKAEFKLECDYKPAGDQPEAIQEITEGFLK